jgi:hypothetical protein
VSAQRIVNDWDETAEFTGAVKRCSKRPLDEPFIPLGDPDSVPPGTIRIKSDNSHRQPIRTGFNTAYIPLSGILRRRRRELIQRLLQLPESRELAAPVLAAEMQHQEEQEIPYVELLGVIFGKGADWRIATCLEAKHDPRVRNELASWLSKVVIERDDDELMRFQQAVKTIKRIEETGPAKRPKTLALLFVLRCWFERQGLPTEPQVRQFLVRAGIPLDEGRKNEARDIFNRRILGILRKGKPGRKPKYPSSKNKS